MASYMTTMEIKKAMEDISRDIERLQTSTHQDRTSIGYNTGATFLSTPVVRNSTPVAPHQARPSQGTSEKGNRSKKRQSRLDRLLGDERTQWKSEYDGLRGNILRKHRDTPSLIPVVGRADGSGCVDDVETGRQRETTYSGTPVIRVAQRPATEKHGSVAASRIRLESSTDLPLLKTTSLSLKELPG